jgi:hypothetical protein
LGTFQTGQHLVGIVKLPQSVLNRVEVWSPAIAAASITLLVVLLGRRAPDHEDASSTSGGGPRTRPRARWLNLRGMMLATALIGLNFACFIYRPILDYHESQPFSGISYRPGNFLDMLNIQLQYRAADGVLIKHASDGSERPATLDDYPLPLHRGDNNTRVLATIISGNDGGIVAYEGNPGFFELMLTRPRVIEQPTISRLEMWSTVLGGVLITLLAFCFMLRPAQQSAVNPVD